jgi:CxxC-x17-CxxC domain-containing protein
VAGPFGKANGYHDRWEPLQPGGLFVGTAFCIRKEKEASMPNLRDKVLQCVDCGSTFTFTVRDQEFYLERGFSEPKRCPACRAARKSGQQGGDRYNRPPRQMYDVVCADCGTPTQVPFKPRDDRPVYCKDCYEKNRYR